MKVKDIMEPVRRYLSPDDTLKEAVIKMNEAKRRHGLSPKGMVVLDEQGKLIGIMAIKDVLRAILPGYLGGKELFEMTWDGMLEEMVQRSGGKKVREIMSEHLVTVYAEDSLMKCAELILAKNLQRLPVINEEGQLVGIVYIRDIYEVITKIFREGREGEL